MVKIFAFLDLEQISADFEIERFETGSTVNVFIKASLGFHASRPARLPYNIFLSSEEINDSQKYPGVTRKKVCCQTKRPG